MSNIVSASVAAGILALATFGLVYTYPPLQWAAARLGLWALGCLGIA